MSGEWEGDPIADGRDPHYLKPRPFANPTYCEERETMEDEPITSFQGQFRWLSNFYPCDIWHDGIHYPSVEHAYQAAKTLDFAARWEISQLETAGKAKRAGRNLCLRPDWEDARRGVMQELLIQKFLLNYALRQKLKRTGKAELIEGNTWGDTYWGIYRGQGQNHLGQLLMALRRIL